MSSLAARPGASRPGVALTKLLASPIAIALAAGLLTAPGASGQAAEAPAAPAAAASGAARQHDTSSNPGHDMSTHDKPAATTAATSGHAAAHMRSALGPYPMSREGSGTSWQPEATPMTGLHVTEGDWSLMAHGYVNAIYDRQTGPRGDDKAFTSSMLMLMGNRPAGPGTLGLRAMLSLDPTQGKSGYPLLFQTGETADGVTHLVDRQHPHDLFMELSTSYSVPLAEAASAFVYFGFRASRRSARRPSCIASPACAIPRRRSATTGSTRRTSPSAWRRSASAGGRCSSRAPGSTAGSRISFAGTSRPASSTPGRRG